MNTLNSNDLIIINKVFIYILSSDETYLQVVLLVVYGKFIYSVINLDLFTTNY